MSDYIYEKALLRALGVIDQYKRAQLKLVIQGLSLNKRPNKHHELFRSLQIWLHIPRDILLGAYKWLVKCLHLIATLMQSLKAILASRGAK